MNDLEKYSLADLGVIKSTLDEQLKLYEKELPKIHDKAGKQFMISQIDAYRKTWKKVCDEILMRVQNVHIQLWEGGIS